MPASNSNGHAAEARGAPSAARRRTPWPLIVVAVLFVVVPFLAWYGTWFGRALTDEQIEQYLGEADKPRHVQHALSEIEKRISKGDREREALVSARRGARRKPREGGAPDRRVGDGRRHARGGVPRTL